MNGIILSNVSKHGAKMSFVPNQRVPILLLPDRTSFRKQPIQPMRRDPFPRLYDFALGKSGHWHKQHMHMIRHDHIRIENISCSVKMPKNILNQCTRLLRTQDTSPMPLVKPLMNLSLEKREMLLRISIRPRLGMNQFPFFAFCGKLRQQVLGKGISQSKGQKTRTGLLLPMRQVRICYRRVGMSRIETRFRDLLHVSNYTISNNQSSYPAASFDFPESSEV